MPKKIIIIGGSAGSFSVVTRILSVLPNNYNTNIILCLHRLKHIRKGFSEALSMISKNPIVEPFDKEKIKDRTIYLAPANYHLYVSNHNYFTLSIEESVNHSRPSIDVSFASIADVYKEKAIGILLSGANNDGANGLKKIKDLGGITIVQKPEECQVNTMPLAALKICNSHKIMTSTEIIEFILKQT
jgi:two-component system chemotaxis response regulator CheB